MAEMQKEKISKIITTKGCREYQQILQHKKASKIMQTENLKINIIFGQKLLKTPSRKLKRSPHKGHKERCKRINKNTYNISVYM